MLPSALGILNPTDRLGPVGHLTQPLMQPLQIALQVLRIGRLGHSIHSRRFVFQRREAGPQVIHTEVVH
jgi:hypothetical protein